MLGSSWVAAQLVASQEGLSFMYEGESNENRKHFLNLIYW
jgi:hypothetical protein